MDSLKFEIGGETLDYHACGHDANSTILLSAAKQIIDNVDELLDFIFKNQVKKSLDMHLLD